MSDLTPATGTELTEDDLMSDSGKSLSGMLGQGPGYKSRG